MKKTLVLASCIIAMASIASAIIMEDRPHPLTLNGKPFGNAVMINGNLMVSLQDLAQGLTGTPNLGPNARVQANRLIGLLTPPTAAPVDPITPAAKGQNSTFHVRKGGEISSQLVTVNGKTYVPLVDLMRNGFGARGWTAPANLASGAPISLNFVNGDGIFALGH